MNYKKSIIILVFVFSLFFYSSIFLESVLATVGGPIFIERLSYSPEENALYYLIEDYGGRGCPAEIAKMDLAINEHILIMPCDKILETYYYIDGGPKSYEYDQFVQNKFRPLKLLPKISLPKNDISVDIVYLGEDRLSEYVVLSNFQAIIFQDGQKKETINFIGCHKEQPNVFSGYMIPGTDKMVMKISRVGNCSETGYVADSIYILDSISFKDTDDTESLGISNSGPQVRGGDLVVSVQDINTVNSTFFELIKKNKPTWILGITSLFIGLIVGYIIKHKTKI